MSDEQYVPTTEVVRETWADARWDQYSARTWTDAASEFDAWLAEHDRRVAERAWLEGAASEAEYAKQLRLYFAIAATGTRPVPIANPYRKPQEEA